MQIARELGHLVPRTAKARVTVAITLLVVVVCWPVLSAKARVIFLLPGSPLSLYTLGIATAIAAGATLLQRRRRGRRMSLRLLRRALWPRRLFVSASSRADLGFLAMNTLVTGIIIAGAILSFPLVEGAVYRALVSTFGPARDAVLTPVAAGGLMTLMLFLTYEFAYWIDHYTSHRIPFFWEFHRVHHTAETLTPLTNWRMHPIDSLKFSNIVVFFTAPVSAAGHYVLGGHAAEWTLDGSNVILLLLVSVVGHLQHSHVWIAFTGRLGRIVASPAHHQLHHSANPDHHGRNLGSMLVVFDGLFGTLLIPDKTRQTLDFGAAGEGESPHSVTGALVTPFARAVGTLRPPSVTGGKRSRL